MFFLYDFWSRSRGVYNRAFDLILESDIKGVHKNEISSSNILARDGVSYIHIIRTPII